MTARGIVFQCGACRSLVSVQSAVADKLQERAGLSCEVCGGVTWLPFATGAGARVVDVDAPATAAAPLQLTSSMSSTALTPLTPTAVAAPGFSDEQRGRIGDRLRKLGAAGPAQEDLSTSFERLLGHWQSDADHKQFLNKASVIGELAFAGQRYRAILDEVPGEEHAKKAQNELLGLAMASMSREKEVVAQGSGGINRNVAAVAILIVTAIICGAIVIFLPRFLRDDAENESMDEAAGQRPPVLEER